VGSIFILDATIEAPAESGGCHRRRQAILADKWPLIEMFQVHLERELNESLTYLNAAMVTWMPPRFAFVESCSAMQCGR
jgi:hypothetical protein